MPIFNNILAGSSGQGDTGYDIERSVVLDTNSYFTRTPSSAGNRKTYTLSFWAKLSQGSNGIGFGQYSDSNNRVYFRVQPAGFSVYSVSGGSADCDVSSPVVFRDPSAWYHIVIVVDTTESTASNRIKLWVNGSSITLTHTTSWTQNTDTRINDTNEHTLGLYNNTAYPDGYLAEVNFIDGQALTPASFGETDADTNQWKAIEYEGSYGTNGFYLDFATRATDPIDASGNGNNWSSTNVIAGDWKIDSPTNNFATLNPLYRGDSKIGLQEGNLKANASGESSVAALCASTFSPSNGKWYCEFYCKTLPTSDRAAVGIADTDNVNVYTNGNTENTVMIATADNNRYWDFGTEYDNATGVAQVVAGDIVQFAWDVDTGKVWIGINNTWQGASSPNPSTATSPLATHATVNSWIPIVRFSTGSTASNLEIYFNAGQDSSFAGNKTAQGNGGAGEDFYYTPPTGYKALNTNNFDDPAIALPTNHFDTTLVSGNGSNRSITGLNFQPDFLWGKSRTNTLNHYLTDSIRGVNSQLYSDTYGSQGSESVIYTAFNSDGFSLGTGDMNLSGQNYVHWGWKGGGTAVSNTDGSVTSSVSANTTAGFSIVSWTGTGSNATVGHGLSQAPDLIINKSRDDAYNWAVQSILFNDASDTNLLYLNTSAAQADDTNVFQAVPTASVFSPQGGAWAGIGASGVDYIAYCFHSVEGYSKVGSYTGNGNADGTFVYTGFRPAFILWKSTSASENWQLQDNKINPYNVVDGKIFANLNSTEYTGSEVDFVSNGFKLRHSGGGGNGSGESLIYIAFAESPFKYSNAR
jgi:hypothetical protein